MRKSSLGILVFLIAALVVAFLLMKGMQNPSAIRERRNRQPRRRHRVRWIRSIKRCRKP